MPSGKAAGLVWSAAGDERNAWWRVLAGARPTAGCGVVLGRRDHPRTANDRGAALWELVGVAQRRGAIVLLTVLIAPTIAGEADEEVAVGD